MAVVARTAIWLLVLTIILYLFLGQGPNPATGEVDWVKLGAVFLGLFLIYIEREIDPNL